MQLSLMQFTESSQNQAPFYPFTRRKENITLMLQWFSVMRIQGRDIYDNHKDMHTHTKLVVQGW